MSHSWKVKITLPSLSRLLKLPLSAEILLPPDSSQSVPISLLSITFCWHQSTPDSRDQAMSTPKIEHTRGPRAVQRVCEEEGLIQVSASGQLFFSGKGSQLQSFRGARGDSRSGNVVIAEFTRGVCSQGSQEAYGKFRKTCAPLGYCSPKCNVLDVKYRSADCKYSCCIPTSWKAK
ncbi:hypothetical protein Nmel_004957 [Mimus melanotis]